MTQRRVVVAARSALRRAVMVRLLRDADIDVAGQAGDARELLRKVRAHRPDVAIAELPDPHPALDDSAVAVATIRRELPGVGVLLVSPRVDARHAAALLEPGAEGAGYLLERRVTHVSAFIEAVLDVAGGGSVLDPEVVTHFAARHRHEPLIGALSERDRQVLAQIAAGVSNRGIARRTFVSERSVARQVTSIFDKLGIADAKHANRRVLAVLAYLGAPAPA